MKRRINPIIEAQQAHTRPDDSACIPDPMHVDWAFDLVKDERDASGDAL